MFDPNIKVLFHDSKFMVLLESNRPIKTGYQGVLSGSKKSTVLLGVHFLDPRYQLLSLCNFIVYTGLYGSNSWNTLEVDVVCELCDDLVSPLIGIFTENDEEKKVSIWLKTSLNSI